MNMTLKDLIFTIPTTVCIVYVFILTASSSRILSLKIRNDISEEEYRTKRKSITKKTLIAFITLLSLTFLASII